MKAKKFWKEDKNGGRKIQKKDKNWNEITMEAREKDRKKRRKKLKERNKERTEGKKKKEKRKEA